MKKVLFILPLLILISFLFVRVKCSSCNLNTLMGASGNYCKVCGADIHESARIVFGYTCEKCGKFFIFDRGVCEYCGGKVSINSFPYKFTWYTELWRKFGGYFIWLVWSAYTIVWILKLKKFCEREVKEYGNNQ